MLAGGVEIKIEDALQTLRGNTTAAVADANADGSVCGKGVDLISPLPSIAYSAFFVLYLPLERVLLSLSLIRTSSLVLDVK